MNTPGNRGREVGLYLLLAYALTWLIAVPLALSGRDVIAWDLPLGIHYLAQFGPMLAALIVTLVFAGRPGVRDLTWRMIGWEGGWRWLLIAIGSPVALFLFAAGIARAIDGEWVALSDIGKVDGLPYLGIFVVPLWILTNGFGEEVGWRGFLLPRLQARWSALTATLILAVVWAFWHAPAFFYRPGYEEMGIIQLPGFFLGLLAGAILLAWLYNSSGGSILLVAIWHGLFNVFTASDAGQGTIAAAMSAGVMVWAVAIIFLLRPASLSHEPRQVPKIPAVHQA